MTNTGRIYATVRPEIAAIVFGATSDGAIDAELSYYTLVDLAHVLGLQRAGVVPRDAARALLAGLQRLRAGDWAALRGRAAPRGLYLLYERHLIETLGEDVAGWLQTGRSRNDLSATVAKLRLRPLYVELLTALDTLTSTLCDVALATADAVMPAYTHYQPAVPVSYGHYCAGVVTALLRDWSAIEAAGSDIDACPLGACAVGGTSVPIDPAYTARCLGFEQAAINSIDAVASRDPALRLLGAGSVLGVTLSRVASDLLLWSTQEFGLLALPDHVVGSSSLMPQKRNPYLLEHVQGRAGTALGAFCGAVAAMGKTPFSNSVAVGTEALSCAWPALRSLAEAVTLLNEVVGAARPRPRAMAERAEQGFTSATRCAELLAERGVPFRTAHHGVGELVTAAVESGTTLAAAAVRLIGEERVAELDPKRAKQAARFGGGPAEENTIEAVTRARAQARALRERHERRARRWSNSLLELEGRVDRFIGNGDVDEPSRISD